MIRVLVVDDSLFVRKALSRVLGKDPDLVIVGEAVDGDDAIQKAFTLRPDVITLDLEMPRRNGIETLTELMQRMPLPVVVFSSWGGEGTELAIQALELGAVAVFDKSSRSRMDIHLSASDLIAAIKNAAQSKPKKSTPIAIPAFSFSEQPSQCSLLCIGASTGGPQAIMTLLQGLPASFTPPIVVVQHMPVGFTKHFAARLHKYSGRPSKEAEDGEPLQEGYVYTAEAGQQLLVESTKGRLVFRQKPAEPDDIHAPSVDTLFRSVAAHCGNTAVGVLLTGMGQDGAEGMLALHKKGALTIAEAEESCVVYGMPKAALARGAVSRMLPLTEIASFLLSHSVSP